MTLDTATREEIRRRYRAAAGGTIAELAAEWKAKPSAIKAAMMYEYDDSITRDEFVRRFGDALEGIGLTVDADFPRGEVRICHMLPDSDEGVITEGECAGMSIEDYDSAMWRKMESITAYGADTCGWLVDGESGITLHLDWNHDELTLKDAKGRTRTIRFAAK